MLACEQNDKSVLPHSKIDYETFETQLQDQGASCAMSWINEQTRGTSPSGSIV